MTDDQIAQERVNFFADTLGVRPPARLLTADHAPAPELMNFCQQYGASLDWIFLGDVRRMIRDSAWRADQERRNR